jgi:hypothetical protein
VQNETYRDRFLSLGASPEVVHVTGSIKFDGAQTDRANPLTRHLRNWRGSLTTTLSSWPAAPNIPKSIWPWRPSGPCPAEFPRLRLILVPVIPNDSTRSLQHWQDQDCPGNAEASLGAFRQIPTLVFCSWMSWANWRLGGGRLASPSSVAA